MTVDEVAGILAAFQRMGRGGYRVVVRGYESGVDDVTAYASAGILPDVNEATYDGPHGLRTVAGVREGALHASNLYERGIPTGREGEATEWVVWLVGSRDADDLELTP